MRRNREVIHVEFEEKQVAKLGFMSLSRRWGEGRL